MSKNEEYVLTDPKSKKGEVMEVIAIDRYSNIPKFLEESVFNKDLKKDLTINGASEAIGRGYNYKLVACNNIMYLLNNKITYNLYSLNINTYPGSKELSTGLDSALCNSSLSLEKLTFYNINNFASLKSTIANSLKFNESLKHLTIAHSDMSYNEVKIITKSIINYLPQLTTLNLLYNNINNTSAKKIAEIIAKHEALAEVVLCFNCIDDKGAEAIGAALISSNSLLSLSIHHNPIGDKGLIAIAKGLEQKKVAFLSVGTQANIPEMTEKGLASFGKIIASNRYLKELELILDSSDIAAACTEELVASKTLVKLKLSCGSQNSKLITALANLLDANTIHYLPGTIYLNDNNINQEAYIKLAKVIERNTTLIELSLFYYSSSQYSSGFLAIIDALQSTEAPIQILRIESTNQRQEIPKIIEIVGNLSATLWKLKYNNTKKTKDELLSKNLLPLYFDDQPVQEVVNNIELQIDKINSPEKYIESGSKEELLHDWRSLAAGFNSTLKNIFFNYFREYKKMASGNCDIEIENLTLKLEHLITQAEDIAETIIISGQNIEIV